MFGGHAAGALPGRLPAGPAVVIRRGMCVGAAFGPAASGAFQFALKQLGPRFGPGAALVVGGSTGEVCLQV